MQKDNKQINKTSVISFFSLGLDFVIYIGLELRYVSIDSNS